jgi:beta-glucanase (GH16 family)
MKYEYATCPPDYAYRHGVTGSISKKINSPEHLESNLYAVSSFYEAVQGKYGHYYDSQLYQGAMHIYVTVLRNEAPWWFAQRLATTVRMHSTGWGFLLTLQVYLTSLLLRILPAKLARLIPLFFNLYAMRRFEQVWKPVAIGKLLLFLCCFLPFISSCAQNTSYRDYLYELAWSDEFNGKSLDTLLWSKMKRVKGVRSFMHFTPDARFYEFKHGRLRLYARHNADYIPTDTAKYLTAGITSEGKYPIRYGKIEVRARVKGAQGTWPAIWTLPEEKSYRDLKSPFYTELDIMEYVDKNKFAYQTAHNAYTLRDRKNWYNPSHQHKSDVKFEKYNTYSVEILPEEVIFAVNGKETLRYPRLQEEEHQFHYGITSFLMLHMQVNPPKSWSKGVDPQSFPAYLDIDWVRVYSLKE